MTFKDPLSSATRTSGVNQSAAHCMAEDLGVKVRIRVHSDSSAAIGISRRRGLGKIRHLSVGDLWIQERLRNRDFDSEKVLGSENPSDILTKFADKPTLNKMLSLSLSAEPVLRGRPTGVGAADRRHDPEGEVPAAETVPEETKTMTTMAARLYTLLATSTIRTFHHIEMFLDVSC